MSELRRPSHASSILAYLLSSFLSSFVSVNNKIERQF